MTHLLEVKELVTRFYTEGGVVHAVNGISYTLDEGESIGFVGESGSGKSVGVLTLMRLIPTPPGRIEGGQVIYNDRDLLKISDHEMRSVLP
jgi:ABC-type dipeptide/oligopeptide/nickel transport system ATPase component